MQHQIARRLEAMGEWYGGVKTPEGATLLARYQWWAAKESANPSERIRMVKGQYALARDMASRPREYRFPQRASGQTCWQRFCELGRGA